MSKKKKKNTSSKNNRQETNNLEEELIVVEENKEDTSEEVIEEEKEEIVEEVIEEEKVEETKEVIKEKNNNKNNVKSKSTFTNLVLSLVIIISLVQFVIVLTSKDSSISDLINNLIITIFSVLFSIVGITYKRKNKRLLFISGLILLCYFVLNINNTFSFVKSPISVVPDFSNKTLTEVMKWASKNNILVNQDYEYSDMIPEYKVISQSIDSGKSLSGITEIDISISDGPNPYKEIVVPSMIGWDAERVINYINDNYLENVVVEFVKSSKPVDTVIEQSSSGNLKRNDELKLTFSYGEELGYEDYILADFTNKSKFEIEFFMKQHQIKYEFEYVFSSKIKKGFGVKQNVDPGERVKVNDTVVKVSISKGPKIKVPNLTKMSVNEITEWAIKNKLKLNFKDSYDDTIDEGEIIKTDKNENDILEQGTVVTVTLSRGKLKMPKFNSMNEFREWADKYGIVYEEKHEFSDKVPIGEIIGFSYDTGDTIKNGDSVSVTISDGKQVEVPNVIGQSKSSAISKLEGAGLNYNVSSKYSDSVAKDKVISQSISAGSKVGTGTTVSIIISLGKRPVSNNTGGGSTVKPSPSPVTPPAPVCENITVYIQPSFISNIPETTCNSVKAAYPKLKFSCSYVSNPGLANGMIANAGSVDEKTFSTCNTVNLQIVRN
ncbi:MAG: PASTA domain-containing protein [Bacilli bacterium]|nr:PASTA domain-containing protein [Bacilli bacterium]